MDLIKYARNHSLSLMLVATGLALMLVSIPLAEGTWFDLVSQIGGGFLTAGIINLAAGPLKETNKPEEENNE